MDEEEGVGSARAEGEDLLELRAVMAIRGIGRHQRLRAGRRGIEDEELRVGVDTERHRVRGAEVAGLVGGRIVAGAQRIEWPRIEKAPPALPGALAGFVIAAHDDPRRRGEEQARRREEVRLPRIEAKSPRTPGAAGITVRTGAIAIVIVADVNDDVRVQGRRRRGDARVRPLRRIVARLPRRATGVDRTAGVTDEHDALWLRLRQRQCDAVDRGTPRTGRQSEARRSSPRRPRASPLIHRASGAAAWYRTACARTA